jgi:hypothetical protein
LSLGYWEWLVEYVTLSNDDAREHGASKMRFQSRVRFAVHGYEDDVLNPD